MNRRRDTRITRGFTLIELIMGFIILLIGITPLVIMMGHAGQKTAQPALLGTATHLAEGQMERVLNLRFSQIANQASTAFAAPFSDYTYEVVVSSVAPCPCPPGLANDPAMNRYKQVAIIVRYPNQGDVTLNTIVTNKAA